MYINEVRARDMAGHISAFASSNGMIVDNTPPLRVITFISEQNLIMNPSFEESDERSSTGCSNVSFRNWQTDVDSCAKRLVSLNVPDGYNGLVLQGTVLQFITIRDTAEYALEFYTSNVATEHSNMAVVEGLVTVDSTTHVILMHQKTSIREDKWQKHFFRLKLSKGNTYIQFSTLSSASFGLDLVSIKRIQYQDYLEERTHKGHLHAFSVFTHDWSSIHASWTFEDPESDIAEYLWGIGKYSDSLIIISNITDT